MSDISVLDLPLKNSIGDNDTIVSTVSSVVSRIKLSTLKGLLSDWSELTNKPFNSYDELYFTTTVGGALSLAQNVKDSIHSHSNKTYIDKIGENSSGNLTYNGTVVSGGASTWSEIDNKPFDSLSNDFVVTSGVMSISTDIAHTHTNKNVIDKFSEVNGQLLYDGAEIGGGGIDFGALSDALTTGTLTGLTITADTTNENFDITITGMPTIAINASGYWTIDGVSTGQKAQGDNGATPTINSSDKHWYINGTDTNVVAEGQNGYSPTVSFTTITGGRTMSVVTGSGTVTTDIMDGVTTISSTKIDMTCTLLAANWAGNSAPYTQTITLQGITSSLTPIIDIVVSNTVETGLEEEKQYSYITKATTGTNSITFSCYKTKPTIDLNILVGVI